MIKYEIMLAKLQNIISDEEIDLLDSLWKEEQVEKVRTTKNLSNAYDLITSYCFDGFKLINCCLRNSYYFDNESLPESILLYKKLLNRVLENCDSADNKIVYRGDRANVEECEYFHSFFKMNKGKIIEFPNFLSTTLLCNNITNYQYRFKIQTNQKSRGKSIFELLEVEVNNTKFEKEILFQTNTRFIINNIRKSKEGERVIYTAYLTEIEHNNISQDVIIMHSDIYHEFLNKPRKAYKIATFEKNLSKDNQWSIDDDNDDD